MYCADELAGYQLGPVTGHYLGLGRMCPTAHMQCRASLHLCNVFPQTTNIITPCVAYRFCHHKLHHHFNSVGHGSLLTAIFLIWCTSTLPIYMTVLPPSSVFLIHCTHWGCNAVPLSVSVFSAQNIWTCLHMDLYWDFVIVF